MNSYPRREFLLRALAACGTPFLMPLASVEGLQKPQAGTAAAGYFGGRTDAARAIGEAYVRQLGLDTSAESIRKAIAGCVRGHRTGLESAECHQRAGSCRAS